MLRRLLTLAIAATAALATARVARAETIHLRTGETLAGDVRVDGDDVVVDARYPSVSTVRVKKDDLLPESLYELLERRTDVRDAAARRALGEVAERLGLRGAAIVEYRRARDLDPSSAGELDRRIGRLAEGIAGDLLDDAEDLLEEGMANSALVRLHAVLERFPETKSAAAAKALVQKAQRAALAAGESSGPHRPVEEVRKAAEALEKDLAKADEALASGKGHEGASGSRDLRAAQRAVERLEPRGARAKRLVDGAGDATLGAQVAALRERARASLVAAYLRAGTILIQRRAVPGAERYCDKACELDPSNAASHELHRLILAAKALYAARPGPPPGD